MCGKSTPRIAGRPIKPMAFGFAFALLALAVLNVYDRDEFGPSRIGDALGAFAAVSAVGLMAGWWFQNRRMYEMSLLLATLLWVQRTLFAAFSYGIDNRAVWLGSAWALMAGLSYVMERMDPSGVHSRRGGEGS